MTIGKVATAWAGTSGGPGVTQLFFDNPTTFGPISATEAQAAVNAVRTFFDAVKANLPDDIVLTTSPVVDQYNPTTGTLVGTVTAATPPTSVTGTSASSYMMAGGIRVNLQTTVIRNSRRVRGAIYLVPCVSTAFTSTGQIGSTVRTTVNTAGTTMMNAFTTAGLRLLVWSRPLPAEHPKGPRVGDLAAVTGFETSEKGAVLRGRRD